MFTAGPTIVLHPRYVDELKNHPHLDFGEAVRKVTTYIGRRGRVLTISVLLWCNHTGVRALQQPNEGRHCYRSDQ